MDPEKLGAKVGAWIVILIASATLIFLLGVLALSLRWSATQVGLLFS